MIKILVLFYLSLLQHQLTTSTWSNIDIVICSPSLEALTFIKRVRRRYISICADHLCVALLLGCDCPTRVRSSEGGVVVPRARCGGCKGGGKEKEWKSEGAQGRKHCDESFLEVCGRLVCLFIELVVFFGL